MRNEQKGAGRRKSLALTLALAGVLAALSGRGEAPVAYTHGVPVLTPETVCAVRDALTNDVAVTLPLYLGSASAADRVGGATSLGGDAVRLVSSESGFVPERLVPQYAVGEPITPPEGVNWDETWQLYVGSGYRDDPAAPYFIDPALRMLRATGMGTVVVRWVVGTETLVTNEVAYVIGRAESQRPYRLFNTDKTTTTTAQPVDLGTRTCRIFGDVARLRYGEVTNEYGVATTSVVSGVYIDESSNFLYAKGVDAGQCLIVFYDSAKYENVVDVHVLDLRDASQPRYVDVAVGEAIRANGDGDPTDGLVCAPVAQATDATQKGGAYLYQHQGDESYSPKHGKVYALRPDGGQNARAWWYVKDAMGISWPFEYTAYRCSWPTNAPLFVRGGKPTKASAAGPATGAPLRIPSAYSAEVQKYQEPSDDEACVRQAQDGLVYASVPDEGTNAWALVKLTGDDNVWFLPLKVVSHLDGRIYDRSVATCAVATVLAPRTGSAAGFRRGCWAEADPAEPGYLWVDSPTNAPYATDRYAEATSRDGAPAVDGHPSAIVPVNTNGMLEAWWSASWRPEADMPAAVTIPSVVQLYRPVWDLPSYPEIALSSGLGSGGLSEWRGTGALAFGPDASARLPERGYFAGGRGALAFWTRAGGSADAKAAEGEVAHFGANEAGSCLLRVFARAGGAVEFIWTHPAEWVRTNVVRGIEMVTRGYTNATERARLPVGGPADAWHRVGVALTNGTFVVNVDGGRAVALPVGPAGAWIEDGLPFAGLGACGASAPAEGREVAEIRVWAKDGPGRSSAAHDVGLADAGDAGLFAYLSFREGDVADGEKEGSLRVLERVRGETLAADGCRLVLPGPPSVSPCVIAADEPPYLYVQNDITKPGYNPNEEHAFVTAADGGYVAWALRCDLNEPERDYGSEPVAIVTYVADGAVRAQGFRVVATNGWYREFARTATVGASAAGPHPFTLLSVPEVTNTTWNSVGGRPDPLYRDRKQSLWFCRDGVVDLQRHYLVEEGFAFPAMARAGKAPAVGTAVPWMSCWSGNKTPADRSKADEGTPLAWRWTALWPPTNSVPTMKIGQTLTRAADGLAEVWNCSSLAVLYPDPTKAASRETVTLFDPTVARTAPAGDARLTTADLERFGFRLGQGGNLTQRGTKVYFPDMPPSVSDRFYLDVETGKLTFVGRLDEPAAGASVLYVNVLTEDERRGLKAACTVTSVTNVWHGYVDALSRGTAVLNEYGKGADGKLKTTYTPRDHYALAAMGGTNWVVMVENDGPSAGTNRMTSAGDPVSLRVFRVVPEYYAGRVVTRQDPYNLLSQQLSVTYTEAFAGAATNYVFEWRYAAPAANGGAPSDPLFDYSPNPAKSGPSFVVGERGARLEELVSRHWICRYRATRGAAAATMGDRWSDWCGPALAEGWVQRVLNGVTPFTQRMTDLYNNAAETTASMLAQAGRPWEGNVALNQDNLTSVGLIQLYQTLLNVAESMSTLDRDGDEAVCEQLMQAAERLHDLYVTLGDEAYSDAMNPTVGVGGDFSEAYSGLAVDYGAVSSSLFCFDNQVKTLLDEELCLLRGRSGASAPDTRTSPCYNRLVWNFTRGINAGEVAYAVNYDITADTTGSTAAMAGLTADDAAKLYPQGHGDAYGHYLTALKGWYRLLRNPNFHWARRASALNVGDYATAADYYEEAKFAEAAAKLAQTAADVVDRTARQAWRDGGGRPASGYLDASATNAFGYGEWASRGAYGALANWAVANALLPSRAASADGLYREADLSVIDRSTVPELSEICASARNIQAKEDAMDAGLNPAGLSADAVPFDITPIRDGDEGRTHYEQVRERAGTALANARRVLDRAQECATRLRQVQEAQSGYADMIAEEEASYDAQLVAIYGKPYPSDVGPTGTYPQGYDGPDVYHYMWMDLAKYGLSDTSAASVTDFTFDLETLLSATNAGGQKVYANVNRENLLASLKLNQNAKISWQVSSTGIVIPPAGMTASPRPANGELQQAYGEVLALYSIAKTAIGTLDERTTYFKRTVANLSERIGQRWDMKSLSQYQTDLKKATDDLNAASTSLSHAQTSTDLIANDSKALWTVALGWQAIIQSSAKNIKDLAETATIVNFPSDGVVYAKISIKKAVKFVEASIAGGVMQVVSGLTSLLVKFTTGIVNYRTNLAKDKNDTLASLEDDLRRLQSKYAVNDSMYSYFSDVADAIANLISARDAALSAVSDIVTKADELSALANKATALMEARQAARQRWVAKLSKLRYNDMFFRTARNETLARYSAAFDLAQKYAYLTAKAYDYETCALTGSADGGQDFLAGIVSTRSLGALQDGVPVLADWGDTGLAGALAKLDANWNVVKGQLGLNNPQPYATWFSLRNELFNILPGEEGAEAWKTALRARRVPDLRAVPEYVRYCRPFRTETASADAEPGLVIEFSSTIDFAKNFFGKDLVNEGANFDSTWFATKVKSAGVWFEGYNAKLGGYDGDVRLAETPTAYLLPVGYDCLREPGQEEGAYCRWNVVDQVIPAPYAVGAAELDGDTWFPTLSGDTAGADETVRIRRYPAFRAYGGTGAPTDAMLDAVRLTGRSVWNTRWLLIIPAGTLGADRDAALSAFIDGVDANRDGTLDLSGVTDIKLGFKTYSHSGK